MFKIEKIIFGLGFNQEEEEEEGMLNLILRLKPEPDDDFFFNSDFDARRWRFMNLMIADVWI